MSRCVASFAVCWYWGAFGPVMNLSNAMLEVCGAGAGGLRPHRFSLPKGGLGRP